MPFFSTPVRPGAEAEDVVSSRRQITQEYVPLAEVVALKMAPDTVFLA